MEEEAVLSGDSAFNAHFGECIAAIGDIDDDGYQGQVQSKWLTYIYWLVLGLMTSSQLLSEHILTHYFWFILLVNCYPSTLFLIAVDHLEVYYRMCYHLLL